MGCSIASGLLTKDWSEHQLIFCEQLRERHKILVNTFPGSEIISDIASLKLFVELKFLKSSGDQFSRAHRVLGRRPDRLPGHLLPGHVWPHLDREASPDPRRGHLPEVSPGQQQGPGQDRGQHWVVHATSGESRTVKCPCTENLALDGRLTKMEK